MSKFVLKHGPVYSFHFEADNAKILGSSENYKALSSARKGINSIRRNANICDVEDQTKEDFKIRTNPKFEIFRDGNKKLRFRMKAKNGQIVLTSVAFKEMEEILESIKTVKKTAFNAKMEE